MVPAEQQGGDPAAQVRIERWNDRGEAGAIAVGEDARTVAQAALGGVLTLALDGQPLPAGDGTAAAPIAGRGDDLAAAVGHLADDLLAQLDALGGGLRHVRLDGLLRTDNGGYSGWGYLIGSATGPAVPEVGLAGEPAAGRDAAGRLEIRVSLRRG